MGAPCGDVIHYSSGGYLGTEGGKNEMGPVLLRVCTRRKVNIMERCVC